MLHSSIAIAAAHIRRAAGRSTRPENAVPPSRVGQTKKPQDKSRGLQFFACAAPNWVAEEDNQFRFLSTRALSLIQGIMPRNLAPTSSI
jgi:hypothetical protein